MGNIKRLQELTLKDNFLFGTVMINEENCKGLLERVLEIKIDHVEVCKEKSIVYHPEYKGVRLDVYAKDDHNTHYNVEMQVQKKPALGKRSRYYQSQMDTELLLSGQDYSEIPNTYIIFICDFDPIGEEKYRYTFQTVCRESPNQILDDGRTIIFLNTRGKNDAEVPEELVTFLTFMKADLTESEQDFHDPYVEQLQKFIHTVKEDREMRERFMTFEELLRDERSAGREEGLEEGRREGREEGREEGLALARKENLESNKNTLICFLETLGTIPDSLLVKIQEQTQADILNEWLRTAFQVKSIEDFESKL